MEEEIRVLSVAIIQASASECCFASPAFIVLLKLKPALVQSEF
jgi:hypothetical protein